MAPDDFRRLALTLPGAVEGGHMGHADFRVGKKGFATLGYPDAKWAMVKLTVAQQAEVCARVGFEPVKGGWGKRGATLVELAAVEEAAALEALRLAWGNVAT